MATNIKDLYIIGAGDFGRETADTVHEINQKSATYRIAGFIDDDKAMHGQVINGINVLGGLDYLVELSKRGTEPPHTVITIAKPQIKEKIAEKLGKYVTWENIVHPLAIIKSSAVIGHGNVIQHFSSVNSNATVGNHCLINSNCVVGHDVNFGDYSSIMHFVGIMGDCEIENRAFVGAGAVIIPGVTVGHDAILGAGTVVIKDVEPGTTVVGNPARRVK